MDNQINPQGDATTACCRRLFLHVMHGSKLNQHDMERVVSWMERKDQRIAELEAEFAAEREREEYRERVLARVSEELGLPPSIAPARGRLRRMLDDNHALRAQVEAKDAALREVHPHVPRHARDIIDAVLTAPAAEAQGEPRTPELWCVHVLGPDDVHAAPSKAHAEKAAEMFNERFGPVAERTGVMVKAVVAPWPHSPEAHAEGVGSFTTDWMVPQAAGAQGVLDGAYRPLLRGEIMQEGDEYLNDDYSAWEVLRRPMFGPGQPWSEALKPMRRRRAAPAKGEG
ncbi:hypothetical protein CAI21_22330 [Alkalilimnicola ehrlichii]|uniref:Uncharacterized protein n=1 Tax=Alkalilimnicola ehrlichii TaxID=351052 RepID=A0A3E0WT55_9GAMM|nr:hypothetical protein [Alkalilimnicola ehrlichii]RFA24273.1 hypothetical protein CAI21_22330 [Alkalilimnicola ehrlichii]RFA35175.1 hypothetical protein CAL65_13810 [Alkalilimnicola ehrlichii]